MVLDKLDDWKVIDFLMDNMMGGAVDLMDIVCDVNPKPNFFQPYSSVGNFFKRVHTPVSAPIGSLILAAACVLEVFVSLCVCVAELLTGDFGDASEAFGNACVGLLLIGVALLAAVFSPLINLVSVVGSGINNAIQAKNCCVCDESSDVDTDSSQSGDYHVGGEISVTSSTATSSSQSDANSVSDGDAREEYSITLSM